MKKSIIFLTLLGTILNASWLSFLFPKIEEGFLLSSDVDELNPSISPDTKYTLVSISDGFENPMMIVDNARKTKTKLSSSIAKYKISGRSYSMDGVWDEDSKSFVFVGFLKNPDVFFFKNIKDLENSVRIDLGNSTELMPDILKGEIIFVSNASGKPDIYIWKSGEVKKLTDSDALEVWPKFLKDGIAYIEYQKGKTALVVNGTSYESPSGQISKIIVSPGRDKILVVVNEDELHEDLYMFEDGSFRRVAKDVVGNTVFWFDDERFGFVRKSLRKTIEVEGIGKFSLDFECSIDWISSSRNGWIALGIFNPKTTSIDVYLMKLGEKR